MDYKRLNGPVAADIVVSSVIIVLQKSKIYVEYKRRVNGVYYVKVCGKIAKEHIIYNANNNAHIERRFAPVNSEEREDLENILKNIGLQGDIIYDG